jgi:two-component system, NtrC family, response regulator AtoC
MNVRTDELPPEHVIFGCSAAMDAVRRKIKKLATVTVPVLIEGESGTGKGILARYIHAESPVATGPFVSVNCAAIPGTLLESELFGFEKGAFTDAQASKPGWVEQANGGTLFLDGINDIDRVLQAKLLQVLQDAQFTRLGAEADISVQVRFICATTSSLESEVAAGRFRADLYYRINVIAVQLPPLRSRIEDIAQLAAFVLERSSRHHGCLAKAITPEMLKAFRRHSWPGNIRELQNLIERYILLGGENTFESELLNHRNGRAQMPAPGSMHLKKIARTATQDLEKNMILRALQANCWNRKSAARELKIGYRTLLYKLREAGIPGKRSRPTAFTGPATPVSAD